MSKNIPPTNLYQADINDIPPNIPYQLTEPLQVDNDQPGKKGEYLIVTSKNTLPIPIRLLIEQLQMKIHPALSYQILRLKDNLISIISNAPHIPHQEGYNFVDKAINTTPGPKKDIAPLPITADKVASVTMKAADLPKDKTLITGVDYFLSMMNGKTYLTPDDEEDLETKPEDNSAPTELNMQTFLEEGLILKKGTPIVIMEKDANLYLQAWSQKPFLINNDELKVCILA